MKYILTDGHREETADETRPLADGSAPFDALRDEARAWATCSNDDIAVYEAGDRTTPVMVISHETGEQIQ